MRRSTNIGSTYSTKEITEFIARDALVTAQAYNCIVTGGKGACVMRWAGSYFTELVEIGAEKYHHIEEGRRNGCVYPLTPHDNYGVVNETR